MADLAAFSQAFLRQGGYFAEYDTNAHSAYDASGLGRVYRSGAPSALCLFVPCPAHPAYRMGNADAKYCLLEPLEYTKQANEERFVVFQIEDPEPLTEYAAMGYNFVNCYNLYLLFVPPTEKRRNGDYNETS